MSFLIKSAAFFQLCSCNSHGRIVFADGSRGLEVCSIAGGMKEYEQARDDNRFLTEEMPELRRQICHSGLAREDSDANPIDKICVEFINQGRCDPQASEDNLPNRGNSVVM